MFCFRNVYGLNFLPSVSVCIPLCYLCMLVFFLHVQMYRPPSCVSLMSMIMEDVILCLSLCEFLRIGVCMVFCV